MRKMRFKFGAYETNSYLCNVIRKQRVLNANVLWQTYIPEGIMIANYYKSYIRTLTIIVVIQMGKDSFGITSIYYNSATDNSLSK